MIHVVALCLLSVRNKQIPVNLQRPKFYQIRCKLSTTYEDGTEYSETSTHKIHTPGNPPPPPRKRMHYTEGNFSRTYTNRYKHNRAGVKFT